MRSEMQPKVGDSQVKIPLTVEAQKKTPPITKMTFLGGLVCIVISMVIGIMISIQENILKGLLIFIVLQYGVRVLVLKEKYFKRIYREMAEKQEKYMYTQVWGLRLLAEVEGAAIWESEAGFKCIFVKMEKDTIRGKEADAEYQHYEAIAQGYREMSRRKMRCTHIDYMGKVGEKLQRVEGVGVVNSTETGQANNKGITPELNAIHRQVEEIMSSAYTSYDMYMFKYGGLDQKGVGDLKIILDYFREANYKKVSWLGVEDIPELSRVVQLLLNIPEFTVQRVKEQQNMEGSHARYLNPIWVRQGEIQTRVGKTVAEREGEVQIRGAEKKGRKKRKLKELLKGKKQREREENSEVELF